MSDLHALHITILILSPLSIFLILSHYRRWPWYRRLRTAIFRRYPRVGTVVAYQVYGDQWRSGPVEEIVALIHEEDVRGPWAKLSYWIETPHGAVAFESWHAVEDLVWYGKERN